MDDHEYNAEDVDAHASRTPVPQGIRGLLCALAYGWTPASMTFGRVEQLRYGDIDLSDCAQELGLHKNRLKVTLGGTALNRLMSFSMGGQLDGMLEGGVRFHGN